LVNEQWKFFDTNHTVISKIICGHWLVQNTSGSRNFALTSLPNFNNN
jgi:hypothetical protein